MNAVIVDRIAQRKGNHAYGSYIAIRYIADYDTLSYRAQERL